MTTTLKIKNINIDNYKKFYEYINGSNGKNIDSNNAYFQELQKNGIIQKFPQNVDTNLLYNFVTLIQRKFQSQYDNCYLYIKKNSEYFIVLSEIVTINFTDELSIPQMPPLICYFKNNIGGNYYDSIVDPENVFIYIEKPSSSSFSSSSSSRGECRSEITKEDIPNAIKYKYLAFENSDQNNIPFYFSENRDYKDYDNLYFSLDKKNYYKILQIESIIVEDRISFRIFQKGFPKGVIICAKDLYTTAEKPEVARGFNNNNNRKVYNDNFPRLSAIDEQVISDLYDNVHVTGFQYDKTKNELNLTQLENNEDFDPTSNNLYCTNGNRIYKFMNVSNITINENSNSNNITITFDDGKIINLNKDNIFIGTKFNENDAAEDEICVPHDAITSEGKPFNINNFNPDYDELSFKLGDGTFVAASYEKDPLDPNKYYIIYTDAAGQTFKQQFQNNQINNSVILQKIQKKTLTAFTPFDYNHYQSYKGMYSVYLLVNSNILFELTRITPTKSLDTYDVEYKPVLFIPTDKFLGYIPEYDYNTKDEITGYYYKDSDYIKGVTKTKTTAESKYEEKKEELTQAVEDVRSKYKNYYDLKKQLQIATDELTKADDKYRDAEYNLTTLPVTEPVEERTLLTKLESEAKQEQDDAKSLFDRLTEEVDDAKGTIQEFLQEKKDLEDTIANMLSPDEIDDVKSISKSVNKQLIFLVNKTYLKQKPTTEYIVIDYKSKYKLNPFVDKNITNFDYNIYQLYKAYPESCKIFFHNYNLPKDLPEKLLKQADAVTRIEKIKLVLKNEQLLDNNIVIKNLEKPLKNLLTEYNSAYSILNSGVRSNAVLEKLFETSNKITTIYTKLVDFEIDFDKSIKYLEDEDRIYKQVYTVFTPNTINWNDFVINLKDLIINTEKNQSNIINNTIVNDLNDIKNRKIQEVQIINNPAETDANKENARTNLSNFVNQEITLSDRRKLYNINDQVIPYVNGVAVNYIDNNINPVFQPTLQFYKIVIKMSKFINDKYQRFLTQALKFREESTELGNESDFFLNESKNDITNKDLYEDIATQKYYKSEKKHDESNKLFDELDIAQDELNQMYTVCKISINLLRNSIVNGILHGDDETMMINFNLLENLGSIRETQGLIAEKSVENMKEALKYYQMAQFEYANTSREKNNNYSRNKKLLITWLYSHNDQARNYCNTGRVLKKMGYTKKSNEDFVTVRGIYNLIFQKLNELNNLLVSSDMPQFYYDYAMFLISQNNLVNASKFLTKADDAINAKTKGNLVKDYIDKLISGTWFEGFVDKEMGPYNLLAMNVKRELDYVLKTLQPLDYFYLFGNKQTSYTIEYQSPGSSYDNSKVTKEVSCKFLFLQYSQQNTYDDDKTIPTLITKLTKKTTKKLDDNLYKVYAKQPLSYFIIYTDDEDDNFITTAILPYQYPITKLTLKSQLMKPAIYGGSKNYQVAYFDDFGNVIDKKNINDISLFIQIEPEKSKMANALSVVGKTAVGLGGNLLNYLWMKATTIKGKRKPIQKGTNKLEYEKTATNKVNEIVPNELKIFINTSVPGYQKITYSPKMTIRDSNETSVRFDPLVKLDLSVIQKTPKDLRIKQFFNKGLFESLVNFHGMEKVKTLLEAMQEGIINNNISVTLKVLFAINTPIYINGEVYYIADVQWTPGDWTIDTKEKPVSFDKSKINNPYLYSKIVNEDIISGQEQINNLPNNFLTGPNYKGAPPEKYFVARGVTEPEYGPGYGTGYTPGYSSGYSSGYTPGYTPGYGTGYGVRPGYGVSPGYRPEFETETRLIPVKSTTTAPLQRPSPRLLPAPPAASQAASQAASPILLPAPPARVTGLLPAPPSRVTGLLPAPQSRATGLLPAQQTIASKTATSSGLLPGNSKTSDTLSEIEDKISAESIPSGQRTPFKQPKIDFDKGGSQNNTIFFRNIFAQLGPSFYTNFLTLFTEMNNMRDNTQVQTAVSDIKEIQRNITDIAITAQGLSQAAYNTTLGGTIGRKNYGSIGLRVSSPDNFFVTVAKAINQYNYNSQQLNTLLGFPQNQIIIKGRGGSGDLEITPEILKQIVIDYLQNYNTILVSLIGTAQNVATTLNSDFGNQLTTSISNYINTTGNSVLISTEPEADGKFDPNYISLYNTTIDSVFKTNYTFGLIKPKKLEEMSLDEIGNRLTPFTYLSNNKESISQYILSNNYLLPCDEAIQALNIISKLGIIVVSKKQELINPSDAKYSELINIDNNIFYNVNERNGLNYGKWNKFLFLYKETTNGSPFKGYYGIITFSYAIKPSISGIKSSTFMFTIFNKNNTQFSPPLYMLYTIFYLKYLDRGTYDINNFAFYPQIMVGFNLGFESLLNKSGSSRDWSYFDNAYTWFKTPALKQILIDNGYDTSSGFIKGGTRNYSKNYSFLKNEGVKDLSKICYSISLDLELKKGSPLTPDELKQSNCTQKWNTIRKSFANFTDRKYNIPPVYDYSNKQTLKNKSNTNNVTRKNEQTNTIVSKPIVSSGGTRKQQEVKKRYLGKHNKTIKKL